MDCIWSQCASWQRLRCLVFASSLDHTLDGDLGILADTVAFVARFPGPRTRDPSVAGPSSTPVS